MTPQPIGLRCPQCGTTRPNPEAKLRGDDGEFRAIVLGTAEKLCDSCLQRATNFDVGPASNPHAVTAEIARLVADRVLPSVSLAFGHRQDGDLEIGAACSGCRTDFGTILRVPLGDLIVTPALLEDLAGRVAERVNEAHCKILRGDELRARRLARSAGASEARVLTFTGPDPREAVRDLPPFNATELRQFEGTGDSPVEVERLDGLRATVLVDHAPAPDTAPAPPASQSPRSQDERAGFYSGPVVSWPGPGLSDRHPPAVITRDQAIAFCRDGARQQRFEPDSPDWPPQWAIDAVALAHEAGRAAMQGELDAVRQEAADNFQAGANIAAAREELHAELAAAWEATGDQLSRRMERSLAEVVAGIKAKLDRAQAGAESLAQDLVQRNLELGRALDALSAQREACLDKLDARMRAIGGFLAGQDRTEGVIDAAGVWHDLPDDAEDELNAIEAIVAQLESAARGARE